MSPAVATIIYVSVIVGLFWLDRDPSERTSRAIWIPMAWLMINGSRPVSMWLQMAPTIDSPDKYLDGSPIDAVVWGTLLIAGVVVLFRRLPRTRELLRANGPILLFFAYCAISVLWSDYSFVAFKRWIKAAGDLVMVTIVLTDSNRQAAIKRFLTWPGFVLLPLSVLFIKYYPDLGRSYNIWTWLPSYSGVTVGKNMLGMICLIFGLGSIWQFMGVLHKYKSVKQVRFLIAHGTLIAIAIWLCWTANSMTSLSCLAMAGTLLTVTTLFPYARKSVRVHLMVVAMISLSLCALFFDPGGGLVESLGRDPTLTGRTAIWDVVLSLRTNPVVGTGFESFWLGDRLQTVWNLVEKGLQEAHDGYLEVYLNLGWIGVILLAIIIMTGYRRVFEMLRRDPNVGRVRLALLTTGVIYGFTEAAFRMMSPVWIAFLLSVTAVPSVLVQRTTRTGVVIRAFAPAEPSYREGQIETIRP